MIDSIDHNVTKSEVRRKISETWTMPDNYRVKVYTYHDKSRKAYLSILATCTVEESGYAGIIIEYSTSEKDISRLAGNVPATRYNFNRMEEAHNLALESVSEQVAALLDRCWVLA
jgi:hypothetical protein